MIVLTLLALVVLGTLLGELLFRRHADGANVIGDILSIIGSSLWYLVGLGMIIGGYVVEGVLLIVVATAAARARVHRIRQMGVRRMINNLGRRD